MYGWGPYGRRPYSVLRELTLPAVVATNTEDVPVYIVEIALASGEYVRVATEEWASLVTDSRPSLPFDGTLAQAPSYKISIRNGSGFGGAASGFGPLRVNNDSGEYDWLLDDNTDGALVTIRLVRRWGSYDNGLTIFTGLINGRPEDDGSVLMFNFQDDNKRLEIPASPNIYGGTGDLDGDDNAVGKSKPLCLGTPPNVTLQLIDAVRLIYQGHDGAMTGWAHIYDRGIELTVDTTADYATYAALKAATITPGRWASCNASGVVRFGAKPDGTITGTPSGGAVSDGHVAGSPSSGTALTDTASLAHYAIIHSGAEVLVDTASVVAVKTAQPAPIQYFIPAGDTRTVRKVLDDLMGGIGGYSYFKADRSLTLGIVKLPTGTVITSLTEMDWYEQVRLQTLPDDFAIPANRVLVAFDRNFTIQPELDTEVDADVQTLRKDPYSIALSDDTVTMAAITAAFPNATDSKVIEAWFANEADAVAEANRQLVLRGGGPRSLVQVTVSELAYTLNIGDVAELTDGSDTPRYGLDTPTPITVVEFDNGFDDHEINILGLRGS